MHMFPEVMFFVPRAAVLRRFFVDDGAAAIWLATAVLAASHHSLPLLRTLGVLSLAGTCNNNTYILGYLGFVRTYL